ncbi:hypothetical protein V6N13_075989 [Hibiscus sabdariffa]|uniref:Uncharacterized protein n=1 Tax=Hibiscus sabdariffa TaxID=183260 RepID=A0ABR2UDJ3_9ROSI
MPSGSKKRKAAKKKKEQAANSIDSNIPHGNGDPRSQDERESDGGDVGSPASHGDHNHQHPFNQREHSPIQSHVAEEKSAEGAIRNVENTVISGSDDVVAVKIEEESGPKEDLESTLVTIQHIEHENSSSSCSNSSDDESQASEKKSKVAYNFGSEVTSYGNEDKPASVMSEEVLKVVENEALEKVDSNSASGTADVYNLVNAALSVQEEVVRATEVSANKSVPDVVEPGLKGSEEKVLPSSICVSRFELGENEGKFPSSSVTSAESSTVVDKTQHFESHDQSEKQPLVVSAPPVIIAEPSVHGDLVDKQLVKATNGYGFYTSISFQGSVFS